MGPRTGGWVLVLSISSSPWKEERCGETESPVSPIVRNRDCWTGSEREADRPLAEKRNLADAAPYSTSGMFAASS